MFLRPGHDAGVRASTRSGPVSEDLRSLLEGCGRRRAARFFGAEIARHAALLWRKNAARRARRGQRGLEALAYSFRPASDEGERPRRLAPLTESLTPLSAKSHFLLNN